MDERINMTADEFFDHWSEWCSMTVTVKEADLLNEVFVNIMKTFEKRGSATHHRQVLNAGLNQPPLYSSPDTRKEAN